MTPTQSYVRVADIAPLWRYAVGPTSWHSPAIPYYRLASAVAFFEATKRELPWDGVVLYKRCFGGVEVLREYIPGNTTYDPKLERPQP